ncbi:MAG TPA: SGNH/GDSL hydrolase family protein, partial [Planctomycetota bacterium]|nr:SGNH/GDSL hydrolase family protein [Planctomycetota bacterium]
MLVAAELLLRACAPVEWRAIPGPESAPDPARTLYRRSATPGLSYELVPGIDRQSHGARVVTNSEGLRDRERSRSKPDGVQRIAVLGDSFSFGYGVEGDAIWPAVLERLLPEGSEVLNFGVGGYSTRDEAAVLEHKALAFEPDLVLVGYTLNDPDVEPDSGRIAQPSLHSLFDEPEWWQHSQLLRLCSRLRHERALERWGGGNQIQYLHACPETWDTVVRAFARIGAVSAARGLPVGVVLFPVIPGGQWSTYRFTAIHAQVRAEADRHGFPALDLLPVWAAHAPGALRVADDDAHPNALGHRLTAETVRAWLAARPALGIDAGPGDS